MRKLGVIIALLGIVGGILLLPSLYMTSSGAPSVLKTISATGLDQKVPTCSPGQSMLALFYITGIDTQNDVPPSIEVTTNNGLTVSYPNFEFQTVPKQNDPVAGYKGFAPSGVNSATTQIYASWSGTFFLEEYFCGAGPTPRPPTVQFNAAAPTMCIPTNASNIPVLFTIITSGAIDFDHVGSGLLTASGNGSVATNPVTVEPDGTVQDLVTFPLSDATRAEDVNILLTFAGSDFRFDKTDDFTLPMICPLSTTTTTTSGGGPTTTTTTTGGSTTTTQPGGTIPTTPKGIPIVPVNGSGTSSTSGSSSTSGTIPVFVTG
jgi:hypothetical protein